MQNLRSRILAKRFHATVKRGVTLVTVHLEPGLRASGLNLWLLEVLAACILCFQGPCIGHGRLWPTDFGQPFLADRVWPNQLWPALVFQWYGRLWPKPTLAKTDFGQIDFFQTDCCVKSSLTCCVWCVSVWCVVYVCKVWCGVCVCCVAWVLVHGFMEWGFTCGCWFQGFGLVMFGAQDRPSLDRPSLDRPSPGPPFPWIALPLDRPSPGPPFPWTTQNFALFSSFPAAKFVPFFPLWGSSRGILVEFEAPRRSNVHV